MTYVKLRAPLPALPIALVALAGCFTIDAKVQPDASARMTVVRPYGGDEPIEFKRKRAESAHVTVESAEADNGMATMKLAVADVRKLNSSSMFENVTVTVGEKDGTTELVAKVVPNDIWRGIPEKGFEVLGKEVRISVEVPGTVMDTNAQERTANAVTWKLPSVQFFHAKSNELKVSYKPDVGASTTTSTAPSTTKR